MDSEQANSEEWAREFVESIIPDQHLRDASNKIFAESIAFANGLGRSCWAVQVKHEGGGWVYLHVGHPIVCCIVRSGVWLALDSELAGELGLHFLSGEQETDFWKWSSGGSYEEYPEYVQINSKNGYYVPGSRHELLWPVFRALHHEALKKAATNRPLDKASPDLHCPGILKYLRNEIRIHVPDPLHQHGDQTQVGL